MYCHWQYVIRADDVLFFNAKEEQTFSTRRNEKCRI